MEPPTLFYLSWRATLQNAREGRIDLDSQRFPIDFARKVLHQCGKILITDAFHTRTFRWYSENIFRGPQKMYVSIEIEGNVHSCRILLQRPHEEKYWFKWELILSSDYTDTVMVQLGSKILPTKIEVPEPSSAFRYSKDDNEIRITSYVTELKHTKIEMIEWICQAFRCDNISILKIKTPLVSFDEYKNWQRIRDAGYLLIWGGGDYEVMPLLIKERQRRNLKTQLLAVYLSKPLPKSQLSFDLIDVRFARLSLSEYTID
ncbi:unnamed protein product [Caenorhabditis brenneri]